MMFTNAASKKTLDKKNEYLQYQSPEDKAVIDKLSQELWSVDDESVRYIENSKMPPEKNNFDQMNKFFHMQMFSMCLQPLQRGMRPGNLVESFLMYKTMALLNKDFRDNVHATVSRSFLPLAEKMANKPGVSQKVINRRDAILREANGGRLPLDEHTAALTRIGICRSAYNMSREPGADVSEVMQKYNQAISNLEGCMKQDGVDFDATDMEMRTIVGRYIDKDPKVADMFAETSYGGMKRSDFHTETYYEADEHGKPIEHTKEVWRGEFEAADGTSYTGGFSPRFPQSEQSYQSFIYGAMNQKMHDCINGTELFQTINTDSPSKLYDATGRLDYWMQQDGFSEKDIMEMQKSCFDASLHDIHDTEPGVWKDFESVYRNEQTKAYQRSQRGHEFDDMFQSGPDMQGQYV